MAELAAQDDVDIFIDAVISNLTAYKANRAKKVLPLPGAQSSNVTLKSEPMEVAMDQRNRNNIPENTIIHSAVPSTAISQLLIESSNSGRAFRIVEVNAEPTKPKPLGNQEVLKPKREEMDLPITEGTGLDLPINEDTNMNLPITEETGIGLSITKESKQAADATDTVNECLVNVSEATAVPNGGDIRSASNELDIDEQIFEEPEARAAENPRSLRFLTEVLMDEFDRYPYPNSYKDVANKVSMSKQTVQKWFQMYRKHIGLGKGKIGRRPLTYGIVIGGRKIPDEKHLADAMKILKKLVENKSSEETGVTNQTEFTISSIAKSNSPRRRKRKASAAWRRKTGSGLRPTRIISGINNFLDKKATTQMEMFSKIKKIKQTTMCEMSEFESTLYEKLTILRAIKIKTLNKDVVKRQRDRCIRKLGFFISTLHDIIVKVG